MTKGHLPVVLVRNLGKMNFNHALNEQKAASRTILEKLKSSTLVDVPNFLFLVQHHPVFTVGIRNKQYVEDEDKLRNLGAAFVVTDRGGLITFHGPGQLVSYPVLYLGNFNAKKSIRWYIRQLENTIIETCSYFNLKANTTKDVGVWVEDRKIAAIGVHGSRYVTTHGIALNCNVDLTWFSHIIPCGLENKEVTSLTKELQHNVSVEDAVPHFLKAFQNHFPCELQFENE